MELALMFYSVVMLGLGFGAGVLAGYIWATNKARIAEAESKLAETKKKDDDDDNDHIVPFGSERKVH